MVDPDLHHFVYDSQLILKETAPEFQIASEKAEEKKKKEYDHWNIRKARLSVEKNSTLSLYFVAITAGEFLWGVVGIIG
ncbi:hypothetical protein CDAR_453601 [Caerostris darwini]|uniref:Uncharacterized protein n=1 Tax=Caerostris darwini TaxID=1538125 RepID=A0AAV4SHL4_9ARAC|nr:hypothetical protein CDAR_453601 [Caerostris darwini]